MAPFRVLHAQGEGNKEEKFDFDSAGEARDLITLDQTRFVAMQTAREEPGNYEPSAPSTFPSAAARARCWFTNSSISIRASSLV